MDTIKQTADKIEFESRISPIMRVFFCVFGLFPLLAPYELLIKPSWNGRISIFMLFFAIISAGAIGISLFFFGAALFGRNQYFQFDSSNKIISYVYSNAITSYCEETYQFNQIESLQIKNSQWDSMADTYDIEMKIRNKKREYKFGNFTSEQEAEKYLSLILKLNNSIEDNI